MHDVLCDWLEAKIKGFIAQGLPDKYLDKWVSLYFKLRYNKPI